MAAGTICICHPGTERWEQTFPRKNYDARQLDIQHLVFVAKAEIFVCIGVSGRIKGRACGFEVGRAQGSEERHRVSTQWQRSFG